MNLRKISPVRAVAPAVLSAALLASLAGHAGCSNYRESREDTAAPASEPTLEQQARATVDDFRRVDPGISAFFNDAHAYAVFPTVATGAIGIGAASGDGLVFKDGRVVGRTTLTQVSVGAQVGGQSYSEIIFFEDDAAFGQFTKGQTEFSANASAVIAKSGAAATNDYDQGVAVFVMPRAGAMLQASIGGQRFTYTPIN